MFMNALLIPMRKLSFPLAYFTGRSDHRVGFRIAYLKQVGFRL